MGRLISDTYKDANTFKPPYKQIRNEFIIMETYESQPELVDGKEILLDEKITSISLGAFRNTNITGNLILPKNLIGISTSSFYNCKNLNKLIFNDNIKEIVATAFSNCTGLTGDLNINRTIEHIGNGAFSGCTGLNGTVRIPNTLNTSNAAKLFKDCSGIKNVIIENGIKCINTSMFEGCSSLESCELPDSIEHISSKAFRGCENLTGSFVISRGVKGLGDDIFEGCNITKVYIDKNSTIENKSWNYGCAAEIIYY